MHFHTFHFHFINVQNIGIQKTCSLNLRIVHFFNFFFGSIVHLTQENSVPLY